MLDSRRTPSALEARFEHFADEAAPSSPLYRHLSKQIASSAFMLALLSSARPDQPAPNLIFAAVHLLLAQNNSHKLANYYPSLTKNALPPTNAFTDFECFCKEHQSSIRSILKDRRVQTNEAARSAILMPAIALVSEFCAHRALSMVEVGASAGLNLNWDRYSYIYTSGTQRKIALGPKNSNTVINTQLLGNKLPTFPETFPPIGKRLGIDLNPLNPLDKQDQDWLKALIWPEHKKRRKRLEAAISIWRRYPHQIVKGNALDKLHEIVEASPKELPLLVYSTLTLYQFSTDEKLSWNSLLNSTSMYRKLFHLSMEQVGKTTLELRLRVYTNGSYQEHHLANSVGHARSLEWLFP